MYDWGERNEQTRKQQNWIGSVYAMENMSCTNMHSSSLAAHQATQIFVPKSKVSRCTMIRDYGVPQICGSIYTDSSLVIFFKNSTIP